MCIFNTADSQLPTII